MDTFILVEGDSDLFIENSSSGCRDCLIRRISLSVRTGHFFVVVGSSDGTGSNTDTSTGLH
jgi:hypothetical protein